MSGNYGKTDTAPAGAVSTNGYYTKPELWADEEKYRQGVTANQEMTIKLGLELQKQEKDIKGMRNALGYLEYRWNAAQKAGDTAMMQDVKARYSDLYSQMRLAELKYAKGYSDYEGFSKAYDAAVKEYNAYTASQNDAENQWRSTIRDSGTVKAELDGVRSQISQMQREDKLGRDLGFLGNMAQNALVSSSGFAVPGQQYTPQNAQQIAALKEREKLLQEEYQWGLQFEDEAQRGTDEYKALSHQGLEAWQQMQAQQAQAKGKTLGQKVLDSGAAAFGAGNDNPALAAWLQAAQQYREDGSYRQPNEKWSQDQLNRFGYYFATDPQKAFDYAEQVNNQINREKTKAQKDGIAERATASGWAGVGHTMGALAAAPLALADVMDHLAEFAGRGTVTSKDRVTPYDYSQAVVGGISKKLNEAGTIDERIPVIGGKGVGDLYSIGFSTAQSLLAGATGKLAGTGALTLLQFFGQGAAAGLDSGIESGAKGWQALTYGLISGAAEGFAEKIGVDRLFKLGSARTFKGFVKNLLKQSAAEGIEETVTAVLDSAADRIILGENSTFRKAVSEYEQSMSHEDAVRLAWTETIGGIVFDGLSGAISGGLGAGVTTTTANVMESIQERRQGTPAATETKVESEPQAAAEMPAVAQPVSFQEEVQRQIIENLGGKKTAQTGTVELAAPTVQVSREVWQQGQRLAEITGRKLKFYEGGQNENGFFDPKTGEIWVNAKGGDPLAQVFSHELTHSIERAGVYEKLSSLVLNRMQDTGMDLDTAREAKRQQYQRQGKALPNTAAVDQELVAEYVSKYLLTDETAIRSLVQQDRSLGQKIHDFFDRLLAKLGNKNAQERAFLSRAKNIYAKALRQTQNVGTAQTVEQTATAAAAEGTAAEAISLDDLDAQLAAGEITDEEYDNIRETLEEQREEQYSAGERKYSVGEQAIEEMAVADGMEISSYEGISLSSDPRIYSYEFLTAQPDMEVVQLPEMSYIRDASGKISTLKVVAEGIKNALSVGVERDGKIYISNKYTGRPIRVDVSAIRHGLNGKANRLITNARLGSKIGEVVQTAIPINALHNTSPDADGTYAMAAYATDDSGREIVAIVTVEQRSGNITGLDTFDVTHAVSGRQKRSEQADTKSQGVYPIKLTSTITIADLLSKVNSTYRSILSEDVLQAIGENRPVGGHYTERVKYSLAEVETEGAGEEAKPDADYLDAVSRGDTAAAQKMVDAAAKAAGYTIKAYHGTSNEFTTFQHRNKRTRGSLNFGSGFYFSPKRSFAENYTTTGRVIEGYLKLENPYEVFGTRFDRNDLERIAKEAGKEVTIDNVTQILQQLGYDGIIAKDYNGTTNPVNQYVIFDANQVKAADPVTYDDKGNVISLSKRFNPKRGDIRYSLAEETEAAEGKQLAVAGMGKMPLSEFMGQFAFDKAEPWRQGSVVDDETIRQAQKAGYPVIDGVQIIPFVTWVHCTDPIPGTGKIRNNYGLVTGLGEKGTLLVSFRNKGVKADANTDVDQTPAKKDNVAIATEYLTPVRGKYQMTKAEWESLEQAMPEDPEQMDLTDEEWAEIEQLRNRAEASEETAAPMKEVRRDDLPAKAAGMLEQAERKLLWEIADKLNVPKLAGREYLQPIIQQMADEYLEKGSISSESRQLLFEKAYSQAVIVDAEFYNQYKNLKDHLRTTPVTISDRDKHDIADFNDFRKRAFGTLRIVNEGGLPVDSAYQELHSLAPELFPENIAHPADQLMRMFDVGKSIQVTEQSVRDYYGQEEPEYRKWAQNEFEEAIGNITGKLWEVKRYAEAKAAKDADAAPATEEEAMEAYQKLKKARRDYEKVNAKNLLTERDQIQVGRLIRHEIELDHLQPGVDNIKGITAVFEAKQEYDKLCKLVAEYKRHLRGKAKKEADALLKTANDWKDKKVGIAYSRETMERNIFDIVKDKLLAQKIIDKYFAPVHKAEAAAARFKNEYRERVKALGLSTKVSKGNLVSEAHAVQLLGEAEDNIRMLENARGRIKQRDGKNRSEWEAVVQNLWLENPNLDKGKIEGAVKAFRKIYDDLFQQMNKVRVANGYEPVNYRNGYFPHFQPGDSDSILAQFGRALGIDTRIDALPTTINGLTHTFKPGIQWFGNAQERLGFNTAYDAVEGFDKYIEGVASVIHQTNNIQNLRALASQIRYRTSDDGIRQQVDEIYERQGLTDEEKQQLIQEIYSHGKFTLSNFVTELDEYTNLLAGKKSRYDRSIEAAMGRRAYTFLKAWEARVGANMIAGNLTSALTNFIPLTQAGAQMSKKALLNGMLQTLQSYRSDDGMAGMSTFLTNRRGSDPLVRTWAQNASNLLGKPMELIDGFVAGSIVRGAYLQNLKQGMSEAEAMDQADAFAASVMADRSKGAMPTLLQARNPLFKAFTQFQLEVNNQFSEVFKDIPRRFKEKGIVTLAWVLLQYFLGALIYNELYEKLIGRRPALDPIGMLCQAYDDLQTDGFGTAGKNLAVNALEQLPFSSGLTLIGVETDGGRIPASSAVPDLTALWDAATTEGWSAEKRWKEVQDELSKLWYVAPPLGGNQMRKVFQGLRAYFQGGSYTIEDVPIKDEEGNIVGVKGMPSLQYPVYKDNPGDAFTSFVKATLLGKSALGTAQDWVDSGFDSLGAKQTAAYQDMIAAGVKDRDAYGLLQAIQNAQETKDKKRAAVQRDVLRASKVSGDGKAIVYYGLMASEKEWVVMDQLADMGADAGAVTDALMDLKDAGSKANDKLAAIGKAKLTDEEKAVLVGSVIGTDMLTESGGLTQYAKFDYAVHNGMSVDEYIAYRSSGANIDDYLELRDAGATVEDAMEAGIALEELRNNVEDPTAIQKWRVVIDSTDDPEKQIISLSAVMTDSQYAKVSAARGFGVSPKAYVEAYEQMHRYDADGNGSITQAEVTRAVAAMKVSFIQKAALWQILTGSSIAKNNPYNAQIGQRVIDALAKAKAAREKKMPTFQEEIMRQIMQNMGT